MDMISLERVAEYAAEDADVTLRLKQVLWPKVEELDLAGLYLEIEEPMIAVLAEIETAGRGAYRFGGAGRVCRRTQ